MNFNNYGIQIAETHYYIIYIPKCIDVDFHKKKNQLVYFITLYYNLNTLCWYEKTS